MIPILAPGGKIRGYIQFTATGKALYAPGGRLLGTYNAATNQTLRAGGALFGYGDQLMCLLE